MENRVATFLSWILHPILIPFITLYILLHSGTYMPIVIPQWTDKILLVVALGTIILPLCFVLIFYYRRLITHPEMRNRKERFFPLFVSSILYYVTFYFLRGIPVPGIVQAVLFSATLSVFTVMLISIFYGISLHTTAWGGMAGILGALILRLGIDLTFWFLVSILVAGVAGYARLKLNAHRPSEIYTGYLAGFLMNFLVISLFR